MSAENNQETKRMSQNWNLIKKMIKSEKPLIHHITNDVTINDCANITLNWGALPVMASAEEESAQMVENASALVLNLGTISSRQLDSMLKAGSKANELGIPIVLDPVGVGATEFRNKAVQKILSELKIDIIKGNKGEILTLAGKEAEIKGVESIGEYEKIDSIAKKLADDLNSIVIVSSKVDIISNGKITKNIDKGSYLMSKIVGSGCMLTSTLAVFRASVPDEISILETVETAVYYYDLAAEKAAINKQTPAKFKLEFMDNIYSL